MRHLRRRLRTIDEYAEVVKSLNILVCRIILLVFLITILVSEIVTLVIPLFH